MTYDLPKDAMLWLDSARGVYIPRDFIERTDSNCIHGVTREDMDILREGPEEPEYWDAWDTVLCNAVVIEPGTEKRFTLYQDGDLWLVPEGWTPEEPKDDTQWYVALYIEDLAYGGPEEGGWYYNCAQRVTPDQDQMAALGWTGPWLIVEGEDAAREASAKARKLCEEWNKGRRDISSVLSEGQYGVLIGEGPEAIPGYPERRPHYE